MTQPSQSNEASRRVRALLWLAVILSATVAGCIKRFGTGGTGEYVVPKPKLRGIDAIDLNAYALPVPVATQPSTVPSSRPAPGFASPAPAEVTLTLTDVRRLALENNLDLQVELLNPTIARESVTAEEARFEALFTANASLAKTDSAVASQLSGSQTDSRQVDVGLTIPLLTGGTIRFNAPLSRFETNNQFSILNPAYTSSPSVQITQPLLQGAGFFVNAQSIRVAFYAYQQAEAQSKLQVIRVLADAERVYWRLYAARQERALREQEYHLAEAQLERARRQARAGVVPEVDVVRAESGLADTVESIIVAENAVRDRQRDLKRIINVPGLEMNTRTTVLTGTEPAAVVYRLDADALVKAALDTRMELLVEELNLALETANIRVARNATLPLVMLDYTYNVNGLGPSADDALSQVREKRFEDHRVGVRLEVPIGNQAAESRLRRAILSRYQRLATKEQRVAQVTQEVLTSVDQLEANWQRILAARQRVVLAARVLEAEIRQFNVGLRTSTDVLDAQTRLANARLSEISAVADYQISQVDIAFATGTVLGASRVAWSPIVAPQSQSRQ